MNWIDEVLREQLITLDREIIFGKDEHWNKIFKEITLEVYRNRALEVSNYKLESWPGSDPLEVWPKDTALPEWNI